MNPLKVFRRGNGSFRESRCYHDNEETRGCHYQDPGLFFAPAGGPQGPGQEATEMFWKQHNYALAGNDPPYELKDTKDVNKIDIANDIYDHNDDVQHTAKAGGGAPPLWFRKISTCIIVKVVCHVTLSCGRD